MESMDIATIIEDAINGCSGGRNTSYGGFISINLIFPADNGEPFFAIANSLTLFQAMKSQRFIDELLDAHKKM